MLCNKVEVVTDFTEKYPHLSDEAESIYNQALSTYLDLAFPYEHHLTAIPKDRPRAYSWVRACMTEIVERNGISSMTGYRENGVTMEWDSSWVSEGLSRRIVPKCGVPK